MKPTMIRKLWTVNALFAVIYLTETKLHAQPFAQWDFNNSNLVATVGGDLSYADVSGGGTEAGTGFGPTSSFGLPAINGTNAVVMRFPGATNGMGFNLPTPAPNGRGIFVDNYTLILDVLYPAVSNQKPRPILETDAGGIAGLLGTDLAVGPNNGVGLVGGTFDGVINSDTWYRIALVVETNRVRAYVNGVLVGSQTAQADRLVLLANSTVLFLAESLTNTAAGGCLNSVQLRDVALTSDQMQAMGGPSASGIPQTIPSIPSYVQSWKPPGAASSAITDLGAVINPGEATVDTNTIVLRLGTTVQSGVTITRDANTGLITVLKTGVGPLTAGTTYALSLSYTDSQAGAKSFSKQFKAALLFEDFELLTLGTNIDEAVLVELNSGQPTYWSNAWTRTPPTGWALDNSGMPGFGAITNDGVSEWAGWSFASKNFWSVETDNQNRQQFTYGQGTVAVADPDEWDDATHPTTNSLGQSFYFNSYLSTPAINIAGVAPNSIFLNFDSSWRPEGADDWGGTNNQTAVITVSYNGGAPIQKMRWESVAGPNFHPDAENEKVSVLMNNPAGATNMVVKIGLINAANDWWWAFDNLEINIGDIASTVAQQIPSPGATNNVAPRPRLGATIIPGTTAINPASIQLQLDGQNVPVSLATNAQGQFVISGTAASILADLSTHTNKLIYTDNLNGTQTNTWIFSLDYDVITLGTPIWFENFDGVAEAAFPAGWTATNRTTVSSTNFNLNDPNSAAYENFVVVSSNRLASVFNARRFNVRPATLNGQPVDSLISGNFVYGESDNRGGNQVQVLYSPIINLSGITGVQLAFKSMYEQNQDSMGAVEYSIDGGVTWLPALYMVAQADVIAGDPIATLGTVRSDQAWGTNYGAFIGAANVDASFEPYISGRVDDDATESKRIEILSLPLADNQANVRLRFTHTGTGSWYFGIDDLGFYGNGATNVPVQIANQPQAKNLTVGQASSLAVGINPSSTRPLTFQWLKNNTNIAGATSQILALASAQLSDAGNYRVIVSNITGAVTSDVAVVTVENPFPSILTQPVSQYVSAGATASFSVGATSVVGTVTYQWYKQGGAALTDKTNATLLFASAQSADEGTYYATVSNTAGSTNSALVQLAVFGGSLGDGLVAYLPFDGNYRDYSGWHQNGTEVGTPTFGAGRVGQSVRVITTGDGSIKNYVTLGKPAHLQFGTGSFAIGFWINFTNSSDPSFISNKDWDSSNNPGWIVSAQGGGNLRVNATGTPGSSANRMNTTGTPAIRDGNWHFILCSFWRGQSVGTYVDGVLVNTSPFTVTGAVDAGLATNIGQDGTGNYLGAPLDAQVDEVMLWNRAVTPQEVAMFHSAGTNGYSPLLTIGNLTRTGNSVTLDWTGGRPPFDVLSKASLSDVNWTPSGSTTNRSITISVGGDAGFFRVRGATQ